MSVRLRAAICTALLFAACTTTVTSVELVRCQQDPFTHADTIRPDSIRIVTDSTRLHDCESGWERYEGKVIR